MGLIWDLLQWFNKYSATLGLNLCSPEYGFAKNSPMIFVLILLFYRYSTTRDIHTLIVLLL